MSDAEYNRLKDGVKQLYPITYKSDNSFAYSIDTGNEKRQKRDAKVFNFVPMYDTWCLACDSKDAKQRCSKCKSVWFCDRNCQKRAWQIHKRHCGRNLFINCALCGTDTNYFKCDKCPVKFCSENCKSKLYATHKEIDCEHFQKLFGERYLHY